MHHPSSSNQTTILSTAVGHAFNWSTSTVTVTLRHSHCLDDSYVHLAPALPTNSISTTTHQLKL